MAGLDDVLERLVAEPPFRQRLAADPSAALEGYELSEEDRALLASQVTDFAGTGGKVEARASRASMAGLLGALEDLADASSELASIGESSPAAGDDSGKWINLDSYNMGINDAGDGLGEDVLVGGAGGDDPIPAPPSGSGYNELSLQDTRGRETSGAMTLVGHLASDDIVPPPDPSSPPGPIDSISTDDRPERWGELENTLISSYPISAGGGEPAWAPEEPSGPTELTDPADAEVHQVIPTRDLLISPVQIGAHPSSDAPPDGADAFQWDPGDGSDVAGKGEHIEIESWSPGTPPSSAEPDILVEEVGFAYQAIEFSYDAPEIGDLLEPDAGDPQPTGPIADVLYSAGGNITDGVPGDPGYPGPGVYVSRDGGATWVEGAEPRGDGEAAFEYPDSDASGDRHPMGTPEGSLAAGPQDGTSQEGLSLNFEQIQVTYDPDQVGGGPTQAPDALGPVASDGESASIWRPHHDVILSSYQHSGTDGEPAQDGIADLVVGIGSHADGADAAMIDRAEPDSGAPAGVGPVADLDAPTTADPLMPTFAEYSVNLYQGEVGDTPDAADLAVGGPDTGPVEAGGIEAEHYEYPGEYAMRLDGVDEAAPGDGLDVLIAGRTVYESEATVPEGQAIATSGDADRAAGQGGGIISDSGTMTLASSTLAPSDDTVLGDQAIATSGGDTGPAGGGRVEPAAGWLPIAGDWDGDDAADRSLADPAPAAADGWVNVGQTEQYLFGNTDIAEPAIEDVAPPESGDPEPNEAVVGDLNAFEVSDRGAAAPQAADAPMVETRTVDTDSEPAAAEPAAAGEPDATEPATPEREPVAAVVEPPPAHADQPIAEVADELEDIVEPGH